MGTQDLKVQLDKRAHLDLLESPVLMDTMEVQAHREIRENEEARGQQVNLVQLDPRDRRAPLEFNCHKVLLELRELLAQRESVVQ